MIKPYTSKYKLEIVNLFKLNTPKYFAEAEEQELIDYLDTQLEDYFVIEKDDAIIGCGGINYEPKINSAVISWDIIHPDFQGKGIGKELLLFRIDKIKKKQLFTQIIVRTSQLTWQFYDKYGFKLNESKKDYWAKGIDLYYMVLKI